MTKSKLKIYNVSARIVVLSSVEIEADSLDTALVKAKELKITDFVTVEGDHNDSSCTITGLYENESFTL